MDIPLRRAHHAVTRVGNRMVRQTGWDALAFSPAATPDTSLFYHAPLRSKALPAPDQIGVNHRETDKGRVEDGDGSQEGQKGLGCRIIGHNAYDAVHPENNRHEGPHVLADHLQLLIPSVGVAYPHVVKGPESRNEKRGKSDHRGHEERSTHVGDSSLDEKRWRKRRTAYELKRDQELGAKEEGYPNTLERAEKPVFQGSDGKLLLLDTKERSPLPVNNEAVDREQNAERDTEYQGDPEEAKQSPHDCQLPGVLKAAETEGKDDCRTQGGYTRRYVSDRPGTRRNVRAPAITVTFRSIPLKLRQHAVHLA